MENFLSSKIDFEIQDASGNIITDLSNEKINDFLKTKNKPKKIKDMVKNSLLSFAIGDALGVPLEFKTKRECSLIIKDNRMLGNMSHSVDAGTWSDDTSMVIATISSILENNDINYDDIANKFVEWLKLAKYTATDKVFDVGNGTLKAINNFIYKGNDAFKCGLKDESYSGNGSLMRILPIALYLNYSNFSEEEQVDIINKVSSITHANEVCLMGCYIYVKFIQYLLRGYTKETAFYLICNEDYSKYYSDDTIQKYSRLLQLDFKNLKEDEISSSGYVVNTLEAVIWLILNNDEYVYTLMNAVELGDDTDTIAALVGGAVGIIYDYSQIPEDWKNTLKKSNELNSLFETYSNYLKNNINNLNNVKKISSF